MPFTDARIAVLSHNDPLGFAADDVRLKVIGDYRALPGDVVELIEGALARTATNTGPTLTVALNYGAKDEIARAARKLVQAAQQGRISPEEVTHETFETFLDTAAMPDPDLVIRTSGEQRLSNFLLWQTAYSELVFMPCYWPDFDRRKLVEAIDIYSARDRRFGGVAAQDVAL